MLQETIEDAISQPEIEPTLEKPLFPTLDISCVQSSSMAKRNIMA